MDAQVRENLGSDAVVAEIRWEAEAFIGFNGV